MNIFKKIFSRVKTIDAIFDKEDGHLAKVGAWIGNHKFTEEEQAEMNAKLGENVRKFAVDTMSENTERSKTRRKMALLILKTFVLFQFMSVIVFPFNLEWSAYLFKVSTSPIMTSLVLGVGAFFFGSHIIRTRKG
jgi:hypothetical protein